MKLPPPEDQAGGPNLTPVIDIVFLLLIFFLVATRFDQEEREIDTKLPIVVQARPLSEGHKQIVVNVGRNGEYKIEGKKYGAEQLQTLLKEESVKNKGQQTVYIRCDERAEFKFPARVMGICEKYKIKHSCGTQQAPQVAKN